jgi:hypothetical protein
MNNTINKIQQKISITKARQAERKKVQTLKVEQSIKNMCRIVDQNTIRILLDNTNTEPSTHQDEESLIQALRYMSTVRTVNTLIFDGNAWSNVPVRSGVIDWGRILDSIVGSFEATIEKIQLSNLPHEKVIYVPNDDQIHNSFEPTMMYFESRFFVPLLHLLYHNTFANLKNFTLKWSASFVNSCSFRLGKLSIMNILKFNYTLLKLSVVSCNGGDTLVTNICNALNRSNNTLQILDLTNNGITYKGCISISNMLQLGLNGLKDIRLDNNNLNDNGVSIIMQNIFQSNIKILSMNKCNFGNDGGIAIEKYCRIHSNKKNRWRSNKPSGLIELNVAYNPKMNSSTREKLLQLLSIKDTAFKRLDLFVAECDDDDEKDGDEKDGDEKDGDGKDGDEKDDDGKDDDGKDGDGKDGDGKDDGKDAVVDETTETNKDSIISTYDNIILPSINDRSSERGTYYGLYDNETAKTKMKERNIKKKFPLYSLSKKNY